MTHTPAVQAYKPGLTRRSAASHRPSHAPCRHAHRPTIGVADGRRPHIRRSSILCPVVAQNLGRLTAPYQIWWCAMLLALGLSVLP
jgi:hypothetical protein